MGGISIFLTSAVLFIGISEAGRVRGLKGCEYVDRVGEETDLAVGETREAASKRFLCKIAPSDSAIDDDPMSGRSSESLEDVVDYQSDNRGGRQRGSRMLRTGGGFRRRQKKPIYQRDDYDSDGAEDTSSYRKYKNKSRRAPPVRTFAARPHRERGRPLREDSSEDYSTAELSSVKYHQRGRVRKDPRGRFSKPAVSRYRSKPAKEPGKIRGTDYDYDYYSKDTEGSGHRTRGFVSRPKQTQTSYKDYESDYSLEDETIASQGTRNIYKDSLYKAGTKTAKSKGKFKTNYSDYYNDEHPVGSYSPSLSREEYRNKFRGYDSDSLANSYAQYSASSSTPVDYQSQPTGISKFGNSFGFQQDFLRNYYKLYGAGAGSSNLGFSSTGNYPSSYKNRGYESLGNYGERSYDRYRKSNDPYEGSYLSDYAQYYSGTGYGYGSGTDYGYAYRRKQDDASADDTGAADKYKDAFGGNVQYQSQQNAESVYGDNSDGDDEDSGYQLGYSLGSVYGSRGNVKSPLTAAGYQGVNAAVYGSGSQYGASYATSNSAANNPYSTYNRPYREQTSSSYGVTADLTTQGTHQSSPVSGVSYVIFHRDAHAANGSHGNHSKPSTYGV